MDVLYHPETKYLDHYIEIADAIELAFPSVVVRGNEKDAAADDDGHVAEEEEEDYFRVECEDETIAETTAGGRLPTAVVMAGAGNCVARLCRPASSKRLRDADQRNNEGRPRVRTVARRIRKEE